VTYVLAAYSIAAAVLILYEMKLWGEFRSERQKHRKRSSAKCGQT
jgi:hypothetical protein